MSSFEEQKRAEEDVFAQPAKQDESTLHQSMAIRERDDEASRNAALMQAIATAPEPAPHVQAELRQDGSLSQESAERLFQHYAERRTEEEDGEEEPPTTLQVDVRQTSRDVAQKGSSIDDMYKDGMDADFLPDSAIVAADLDVLDSPAGAAADAVDASLDAWTGRRRRGELAGVGDPLSPAKTDKDKKGEGSR